MKVTLNVLENRGRNADRHWPGYIFGGRVRTSTLVLIIAFFVLWWTYDTYRPAPTPPPAAPQVVPPGFVPDPAYTWVPRSQVQPPPTYYTPKPRPTTTRPPPPPPPTTTKPTTTTPPPPPLFQLPVLPPPFGPGPTPPAPAPPGQVPGSPAPPPAPAPPPLFPGLPG